MQRSSSTYNSTVKIVVGSNDARIIRVYPDGYKMKYKPGQYGSLGLNSYEDPKRLIKRPFCISSSMINRSSGKLIDHNDIDYYEFYFNKVPDVGHEQLTPKLFGLNNGDRLFCGEKIVGYYTTDNLKDGMNVLFLGTTAGESPNNSIVTELLLHGRHLQICNISIGPQKWESLYMEEHKLLMKLYDNYSFRAINTNNISDVEDMITLALENKDYSNKNFGFNLNSDSSHVFLSGDPNMIGTPKRKGRWKYEDSVSGIIPILTSHDFEVSTPFKTGNIGYECYW